MSLKLSLRYQHEPERLYSRNVWIQLLFRIIVSKRIDANDFAREYDHYISQNSVKMILQLHVTITAILFQFALRKKLAKFRRKFQSDFSPDIKPVY